MKVATLRLETTLQSHFFVSKASGGTLDLHVLLDGHLAGEPATFARLAGC